MAFRSAIPALPGEAADQTRRIAPRSSIYKQYVQPYAENSLFVQVRGPRALAVRRLPARPDDDDVLALRAMASSVGAGP
jgi:hypothetical protein